jgi:hypothetical protein
MYKIGGYIVISETKEIKIIEEIERYSNDVVIYTTDGGAYGIRQCKTVEEAYDDEVNKLVNKFRI